MRYNAATGWFKKTFGERVQKVTINAGFTCPNRDGTLDTGGCTYCLNEAFNPSYCQPHKPVAQQIEEGITFHAVRYRRAEKFLAYFQAYSNTYAPLAQLRKIYQQALEHPKITGLVIGTRPDCVDNEKLDYFATLVEQGKFVQIEYGVESCRDRTLQHIHRGHTFAQAQAAIVQTAARGIHTGAHFIFGLPGETRDEMLASAAVISALPLHSAKFHQLQIIKGTAMEREFAQHPGRFVTFTLPEYIDFFIDFLERLTPRIMIERFIGEVPPRFVNHTVWGLLRNVEMLRMLEKRLEERDTRQGRLFVEQENEKLAPI
ncbi:MAG: TIGR01212 family radical SAM protein [Dysgonamonadaceae bacterium]|jgi:radical SAM protein (TIGR01212 family)|nr:TIGR01212 family radical SAM protein [Dysgonamonadaceae bacterium]